ncbi:MAG: hypothetical protein KF874_02745 [Rhizobiaceae bacterium]|nr:hypothetical protein [Rhizobiaceae bacterium]
MPGSDILPSRRDILPNQRLIASMYGGSGDHLGQFQAEPPVQFQQPVQVEPPVQLQQPQVQRPAFFKKGPDGKVVEWDLQQDADRYFQFGPKPSLDQVPLNTVFSQGQVIPTQFVPVDGIAIHKKDAQALEKYADANGYVRAADVPQLWNWAANTVWGNLGIPPFFGFKEFYPGQPQSLQALIQNRVDQWWGDAGANSRRGAFVGVTGGAVGK